MDVSVNDAMLTVCRALANDAQVVWRPPEIRSPWVMAPWMIVAAMLYAMRGDASTALRVSAVYGMAWGVMPVSHWSRW